MAGRASRPARRPATGGTAGKAGRGSCARRAGGLAHQGKGGAGRGPSANGDSGMPRAGSQPTAWRRRLAAVHRAFRRIAMLSYTREEIERMAREDREANTDWLPGGKIGVEHCFMEFGARRDPEELARSPWGRHGGQGQGATGRDAGPAGDAAQPGRGAQGCRQGRHAGVESGRPGTQGPA